MPLQGTTDDDGEVSFFVWKLRSKIPKDQSNNEGDTGGVVPRKRLSKLVDVLVTYAGPGIQCSPGLFSLDEILTSGVIGNNRCKKKLDSTKFKITPGEVVIFVGHYHWWENFSE